MYGSLQYVSADGETRTVKSVREDLGLTLGDLSQRIGDVRTNVPPPSRGTLSAVETGKRGVSRELANCIEVALNLPPDSIVL